MKALNSCIQTQGGGTASGLVVGKRHALEDVDVGSAPGLKNVDLELRAGQITGLAGVSGNGQTALADLIGGLIRPASGTFHVKGAAPRGWSPHAAIGAGIARIPEDRHKTGTIADFDLTENAVLELYSRPGFSRHGWMNWRGQRPN